MTARPASTNGFFAQPSSEPLSSALSSTTEEIHAFTIEDDDAPIASSDKYYVPRAKDVRKKQREREEREKRAREEQERKAGGGRHKVKDVGEAKEQLDFSDDEDDELDGLGGAVRDSKPAVRTQPPRTQKEEYREEEKEEEEEEEKQQPPRITVVTHKPAASLSSTPQPTILTRTAVSSSFQQKKEEMSDEEDDDVEANTKQRKQPTLAQRMSDEEQPSSRTSHTSAASTTATANVAPLINPVALSFFLRRLALTAMGGLQLSFEPSRPPVLVYVMSIASFAVAPILVIIFSLVDHTSALPSHASVYIAGLVAAGLHAVVHLPSLRQPAVSASEDWSAASIFAFLFPRPAASTSKTAAVLLVVNCSLYGVLVALSTSALSFSTTSSLFHSASPLFLFLAYCSLALCLYPLVRGAPVEPNQYRADTTLLPSYNRPLYVLALLVPCVVSAVPAGVSVALLLCLLFVPLMCTAGVLSEPAVLLLWAVEQCNILLFGGHVSSTDHRTVVGFTACVAATATIAGLRCLSTSPAVPASIAVGVLLSHCFLLRSSLLTVLTLVSSTIGLPVAGLVMYGLHVDLLSSSVVAPVIGSAASVAWDVPIVILSLLFTVGSSLHRPYFLRIIRNPLHRQPQPGSRGWMGRGAELVAQVYTTVYLTVQLSSSALTTSTSYTAASFILAALLIGQYRRCWSDISLTLSSLALLVVVDQCVAAASAPSCFFLSLPFQLRFFLSSLLLLRLSDLADKLYVIALLTYTSNHIPRLQTRHPRLFHVLAVAAAAVACMCGGRVGRAEPAHVSAVGCGRVLAVVSTAAAVVSSIGGVDGGRLVSSVLSTAGG